MTLVAKPDYLNVFLGRIGAFIADNKIGDGSGAGENAVLSSQTWVTRTVRINMADKTDSCQPEELYSA